MSKIKNLHRMTYKLTGMMPQLQLAGVGTPYTPSGEPGKAEKPGIVSAAAALGGAAAAAALQSAAERLRAMPHTPELARAGKAVSGWLGGLRRKVYAVDADPANHYKYTSLGRLRLHEVGNPPLMSEVYKKTDIFITPRFLRSTLSQLVGGAMIIEDGKNWKVMHDIVKPEFGKDSVFGRIGHLAIEECDNLIEDWKTRRRIDDVEHEMLRMTGRVMLRALFGDTVSREDGAYILDQAASAISASSHSRVGRALEWLGLPYGNPAFLVNLGLAVVGSRQRDRKIPLPRHFAEAKENIDKVLYRIIRERRALHEQPRDIMAALLATPKSSNGQLLTDDEVRDQLLMLIVAGHETTAAALTFGIMEAAQRPDVQDRLRDEFRAAAQNGPVTPRDYSKLPYAVGVLKESVRLHSPVPGGTREVNDETVGPQGVAIGGVTFMPGDYVSMDLRKVGRNPAFWDRPEDFVPERHAKSNAAFMPFGKGPRTCTGMFMAVVNSALSFGKIFNAYSIKPVHIPDRDRHFFTTHPGGKVAVELERRQAYACMQTEK